MSIQTLPAWRFFVPLALQLLIVAAVPAPKVWAHATGTTVLLKTAPRDPYDVLRGRYMTLGYADARTDAVEKLPGGKAAIEGLDPKKIWIELAPGAPDKPWKALRAHAQRPDALQAGHVAIKGRVRGGIVDWELGEYFVPEAAGDGIQLAMDKDANKSTWVEARVASDGTAVLEALWIAGKRY